MSTQNFATLRLTTELVNLIDAGLDQLESASSSMVTLTPEQKAQMVRVGDKSESFYRQTLRVLADSPQILSANMNLADATGDLQTSDLLQPRLIRLSKVFRRFMDTDLALRSDAMALALQGYKLLKVTGRSEGLEPLRRELSTRFARKRKTAVEKAVVERS